MMGKKPYGITKAHLNSRLAGNGALTNRRYAWVERGGLIVGAGYPALAEGKALLQALVKLTPEYMIPILLLVMPKLATKANAWLDRQRPRALLSQWDK